MARWPFIRIPTRKMRPATHAAPRTKTPSSTSEASHCHTGTEVANSRAGITSGLKNGTRERMTPHPAFGLWITPCVAMKGRMISIVIGSITCWASCSLLIVAPAPANMPA